MMSVAESLESTRNILNSSTAQLMLKMDDRLKDSYEPGRVLEWKGKAERIKDHFSRLTAMIYDHLYDHKKNKTLSDTARNQLYATLTSVSSDMLKIDSSFIHDLESDSFLLSIGRMNSKSFESWFDQSSAVTIMRLHQIRHHAQLIEYKLINHCFTMVGSRAHFESYTAIVGQNSNYVSPGEEMEIMAGMGEFSLARKPRFNILGKEIMPGEDAAARYKFKAPSMPGKYKINVKISYTDLDGQNQNITKVVEYTVGNEK
jgi:hypothetical protein